VPDEPKKPDREWPEEPETGIICPVCSGEQLLVEDDADGRGVRGRRCECCEGVGVVTPARMRAYRDERLAKAIERARER
jgi:hypothetical protein